MLLKPAPGRTVYYERSRTKLPEEGADIPTPLSTHWHRAINAGDVIVAGAAAVGASGGGTVPGTGTVAGGETHGGEHWTHPKDEATAHGAGSVGAAGGVEPAREGQWSHPRPESASVAGAGSIGGAASVPGAPQTATGKGA